jgi:hypothetical protein
MQVEGPWYVGSSGSAFCMWVKWAGGLTWALPRLVLMVLCIQDPPIPSPFLSWVFGPSYTIFVAFMGLGVVDVSDVAATMGAR